MDPCARFFINLKKRAVTNLKSDLPLTTVSSSFGLGKLKPDSKPHLSASKAAQRQSNNLWSLSSPKLTWNSQTGACILHLKRAYMELSVSRGEGRL